MTPAAMGLDWAALASARSTPFPPGWNPKEYVFFSPRDSGVHDVILAVIQSAGHAVMANHYGFDDQQISDAMLAKAADPEIAFILNLDATQAGGVHEKALLERWQAYVGTSVAVGQSIKHAISHLKVTVVDHLYILSGSTNLSLSGEAKQDNELRVTCDPLMAGVYESVLLLNHTAMLAAAKSTTPATAAA